MLCCVMLCYVMLCMCIIIYIYFIRIQEYVNGDFVKSAEIAEIKNEQANARMNIKARNVRNPGCAMRRPGRAMCAIETRNARSQRAIKWTTQTYHIRMTGWFPIGEYLE